MRGLDTSKSIPVAGKKWKEQAELVALVGGADINKGVPGFGWSVALTALHEHGSADFDVIGAARDNPKGDLSGSAYIFARSRNTWKEQAKLVARDGAELDNFGWAVAIERNIAVVGSPGNDHAGSSSGAAYVSHSMAQIGKRRQNSSLRLWTDQPLWELRSWFKKTRSSSGRRSTRMTGLGLPAPRSSFNARGSMGGTRYTQRRGCR